jgi:predicted alpha-1,6-mannanase (GH76 family)
LFLPACRKQKDDGGTAIPAPPPSTPYVYKWVDIADSAQSSLRFFWYPSKQYYTRTNGTTDWTDYWPSAHALDILVDLYMRKPSAGTKAQMKSVTDGVSNMNGGSYLRDYYDDMEWMALACLRAYKATSDPEYKDITMQLWTDIKTGWSADLGGGIWWRKDHPSKNTPSNLPASMLASMLFRQFGNRDDSAWAVKIYDWEKKVLYDATSGLVYDNIDASGSRNTTWKFTYNQGTFIGAALQLYLITQSSSYLTDAMKAADYTLLSGQLTSGGILKDEGGGDGGLFKAIFVRNFTELILDGNLNSDKKTRYTGFLETNAEKLWSSGTRRPEILFGSAWNTPPGVTTDFTIQLSGISLFESMAKLKNAGLVN